MSIARSILSKSALKSAKAVIKNGIEVGRSHASNYYGIEYDNITYAAPVIINGTRADIMVNVADFSEYKGGQVYCSQIILDNGETYGLNAPPRTDGKKRKKTKDELWLENYKKQKAKNEQRRQQEAAQNQQTETKVSYSQNDNAHYDYSKSFAEQIEDYKAGKFPERDTFILGGTPDIYQKIGLSALPMTMDQTHVDYALNGTKNADHQLGEELLKQLPNLIKKPVAIIESATQPNNSAIVIVRGKVNEHQLMAAVHIGDVGKQNKIDIDSNHVASTQGRKNTVTKLLKDAVEKEANGETAVYYWNKTEALSLAVESGLQLPGAHISDGLLHSIFDAGSPVNRKYLEQTETRQFKNWFGKSVVRNADGTPEKVYHGTAAYFTVFERGDIGYHVGTKAQAEDRIAGVEGGHIMELYASIQNPLYAAMDFGDWHGQNVAEMLIETEQFEDFDNRAEIEERLSEIAQMGSQQEADTALRKYLQDLGYDGIVYENRWEGEGESYIVFESSQLKSATDNIGLFDRNNPDIRFSLNDSFRTDQICRRCQKSLLTPLGSSLCLWTLKVMGVAFGGAL